MRDDVEVDEVEAGCPPGVDAERAEGGALRRQGMPLALLATYPVDPVVN